MIAKKPIYLLASSTLTALFVASLSSACSSDSGGGDGPGGGSAGAPAAGSLGAGTPGVGGFTGGTSAGGSPTGGSTAAGTSSGGTAGSTTGGMSSGGTAGSTAGGTTSGGMSGGGTTGGTASGGTATGGTSSGGSGGGMCTNIRDGKACPSSGLMCMNNACGIADVGKRTCNCVADLWDCESCSLMGAPAEVVGAPATPLPACTAEMVMAGAAGDDCTTMGVRCQAPPNPANMRPQICVCWSTPTGGMEWDCDNQPWM